MLRWFWALYGATSPGEVLLEVLRKRLPEGAVRRCPAGFALDSGRRSITMVLGKDDELQFNFQNIRCSNMSNFHKDLMGMVHWMCICIEVYQNFNFTGVRKKPKIVELPVICLIIAFSDGFKA